ncbi:MAG TPA: heavy-metal-associated domain-containing protein [Armatimonadota bacterium]|jgi:copper chaperone CopZ
MATIKYVAPNIKCEGCAETISSALSGIAGVYNVKVDIPEKVVTVEYDEDTVSGTTLKTALADSGFPAE